MTRDEVEARYISMFGSIPPGIERRLQAAEAANRFEVVTAIEAWRAELLDNNPLSSTTQRLVHFGMTLAVGDATITADHARSAMRAGATLADLHGVCETAAVVLGMPGYTLRSEEHTSELQSLMRISYAVFCLKKK